MLDYVTEITINDFVGVLRGRLVRLGVDSEPRDMIFAVQNVHSLANIIGDRISDARFRGVQDLLFRELTADEKRKIKAAKGHAEVTLERRFGKPTFKLDAKLNEMRIEMNININGKMEGFKFGHGEFFDVLTKAFGDDPVVPFEKLVERYDKP